MCCVDVMCCCVDVVCWSGSDGVQVPPVTDTDWAAREGRHLARTRGQSGLPQTAVQCII